MTISLSTIKPAFGSTKKRKRVGRGNASGHGTYSTRGQKGQKSRSGVTGLKRLGMRQVLLRTPKKRGFRSLMPKNSIVSADAINRNFKDNDIINPVVLKEKGLIDDSNAKIKILGPGDITKKNLTLRQVKTSQKIADVLLKLGGKIE